MSVCVRGRMREFSEHAVDSGEAKALEKTYLVVVLDEVCGGDNRRARGAGGAGPGRVRNGKLAVAAA